MQSLKIGVVGAGLMGHGIAYLLAAAGHHVGIYDPSAEWRNTLPQRCSGLKFDDAFTYATSLSQLCSTDIIYPLQRTGGSLQRGAGCGLGQFVPVELAD